LLAILGGPDGLQVPVPVLRSSFGHADAPLRSQEKLLSLPPYYSTIIEINLDQRGPIATAVS
jgi:hypothetical protein